MTFGFHRRSACSTLKNVVSFNLIAVSQEYFMGCLTYECNEKACPHRRWEQLICGRVTSNHDRETWSSNVRPPLIRHGTRPGDSEPSSVIKVLGPNVLFIPNFATHLSLSSLDSVSVWIIVCMHVENFHRGFSPSDGRRMFTIYITKWTIQK